MSLRINNNVAAMNALRNLGNTTLQLNKALARLSSGLRINVAADDPAGLIISEQLRGQISSLRAASRNVSEATNFFNIGERALEEVNNLLVSMRALAVHAANGATSDDQRMADDLEYQNALASIARIFSTTRYAGDPIFDAGEFNDENAMLSGYNLTNVAALDVNGDYVNLDNTAGSEGRLYVTVSDLGAGSFQVLISNGTATVSQTAVLTAADIGTDVALTAQGAYTLGGTIHIDDLVVGGDADIEYFDPLVAAKNFLVGEQVTADDKVSFGMSGWNSVDSGGVIATDVTSAANAELAITALDSTTDAVSIFRGSIGAIQKNVFETRQRTIAIQLEAVTNSESNIRDANIAEETTNFTKYQILVQAGTAVLAQANVISQNVLQLLG